MYIYIYLCIYFVLSILFFLIFGSKIIVIIIIIIIITVIFIKYIYCRMVLKFVLKKLYYDDKKAMTETLQTPLKSDSNNNYWKTVNLFCRYC